MSQRLGQKLYRGSKVAPSAPPPGGNGDHYEKPPAQMSERRLAGMVCREKDDRRLPALCSPDCVYIVICEYGKEWLRRHPKC